MSLCKQIAAAAWRIYNEVEMNSPAPITATVDSIARRQLVAPVLLFLTGHRPLAFAAGHVLAVAAPVAAVLGQPFVMQWAEILSTAEGVAYLESALHTAHASQP